MTSFLAEQVRFLAIRSFSCCYSNQTRLVTPIFYLTDLDIMIYTTLYQKIRKFYGLDFLAQVKLL